MIKALLIKYHRLSGLNNRLPFIIYLTFYSSEGQKNHLPGHYLDLVLDQGLLSGLSIVHTSLCKHITFFCRKGGGREGGREGGMVFLFCTNLFFYLLIKFFIFLHPNFSFPSPSSYFLPPPPLCPLPQSTHPPHLFRKGQSSHWCQQSMTLPSSGRTKLLFLYKSWVRGKQLTTICNSTTSASNTLF